MADQGGIIQSTIGGHPMAAAAALGVLVLVVVVLIWKLSKKKSSSSTPAAKTTYVVGSGQGANRGGLPFLGADHAGSGGDLARASTLAHASLFDESLRPRCDENGCGNPPAGCGVVTGTALMEENVTALLNGGRSDDSASLEWVGARS